MVQFIISTLSLIINMIFMQMKHPLAMGFMLLTQTFFVCLISGNYSKSFWFSYVLFLVFLGGMLVLFIYVTSLASNEMFSFSMKILIISLMIISLTFMSMMLLDFSIITSFINNNEMSMISYESSFISENSINLNKLYNFPTNLITILLINYLFLTLVAVVKITDIFYGPLRQKM